MWRMDAPDAETVWFGDDEAGAVLAAGMLKGGVAWLDWAVWE